MDRTQPLDSARCEALALRVAAGDGPAWAELLVYLWPAWLRMVRKSRSMGPFSKSEDHVRNVVTNLAEKLGGEGARGLKLYAPWRERHHDKTFDDWLRIVTANAVRDYVRGQMNDAMAAIQPEPSVKRLLNEFRTSPAIDQLGARPPVTAAQTTRQLLAFANAHLSPPQLRALALWMEGATFEDIAEEMALDEADAARKLVRAAVALLRREFAAEG